MAFMWEDKPLLNLTATTNPTVNDDTSRGYSADPASFWYNTSSGAIYQCVDATQGAAVWIDITVNAGSNPTFTSMIVSQNATIRTLITSPEQSQAITAVGDTIPSTNTHIHLTPDADYVMTSTPTIAAGVDGQWLLLHNTSNFTVDIQDNSVLVGSGVFLGGADSTLRAQGTMLLHYNSDLSGWSVISNPNGSVASGANADLIEVRNQSGAGISAGSAVYATGWNVGQMRITIGLADADNAAAMPSIGFAAQTIANGANGQVVTDGNLIGLIDTSVPAVGSGVWISTTPGAVVFTRPSGDAIQRIGTVTRSAAAGNILVQGAGRTNDVPHVATMLGLTLNESLTLGVGALIETLQNSEDVGANQDDWGLNGTYFVLNNTTGGVLDITGMPPRGGNDIRIFTTASANGFRFRHQNAGSGANNQLTLSTGADITVPTDGTIAFIYDSALRNWRDIFLR